MKKRQFAKLLHLGTGVHSFGNQQSLVAKAGRLTLEIIEGGVLATHLDFKRKAFVPYANIKAIEFDYSSDFGLIEEESPKVEVSEDKPVAVSKKKK